MNRIHSQDYFEKRILFDGLEYLLNNSLLVPVSDVDGILDAHGKGWLVFEVKYGDSPVPTGQKIMLERLVKGLLKTKPVFCLICQHQGGESIYLKDCKVSFFYCGKGWQELKSRPTVKMFVDWFLSVHASEMLPHNNRA